MTSSRKPRRLRYHAGEKGKNRVRLFAHRSGNMMLEYRDESGAKKRISLQHADLERGKAAADALAAELRKADKPRTLFDNETDSVRLRDLCKRFLDESPMLLDNTDRSQKDARTRLSIIRATIGDARDVRTLSENDVRQYEARRRAGGISYGDDGCKTEKVRQRTVQSDIKLLKQVFNWACSVTHPDGSRLLERNPIQYVRVKGEHDVMRPIASYERFEATREAMRGFQQRYAAEAKSLDGKLERARAERRQVSWVRAEVALVLLEATGKRRSSIVGLQWSDFDYAVQRVTWRPEHDKKRKTWVVPYPASFFETVREFQRRLGTAGGYVFPRHEDAEQHAPCEMVSQWIRKAEVAAGLPKLDGGTCHPYRRKWRSERRHCRQGRCTRGWMD